MEVTCGSDQHGDRSGDGGSGGMAEPALERMYPVVFFDALRVKIRDEGTVKNKAVYLALGVQARWNTGRVGLVDRAE